jgi:Ca2+-binding RTX toxin-like protein
MARITFGPLQTLDSFTYSGESTFSVAVRYLYSADLNGDGLDELVFSGFETQLNTPENYTNTKLAIYGWQNGVFTNQTNQWLPNLTNAVEGVGDVGFGDFNGDGRVDLYLSAYTDMDHPVNAYSLINQGTYFVKVNHGQAIWQHGVAVADINNDGFSDVFASGYDQPAFYLGSPSGLILQVMENYPWYGGGSGVALADFIGDGSISMITVDGWIDGVFDTGLYSFGPNLELSLLSVLPQSRMGIDGHDIRVRAFDFSHDGLMDAIVFTRAAYNGTVWPTSSEIQFLENQGNGSFLDVTSSRLIGFEQASNASYAPYFVDINRDGLIDIFISESSFTQKHLSTAVLLAQQDGSYIDTGRDELSAYVTDQGGIAGLVRGPNNQFYLVTESHQYGSGNATVKAVALYFPERDDAESLGGTMLGDHIYGMGGDDRIFGNGGNDLIDGGFGTDTASFNINKSAVSDIRHLKSGGAVITSSEGTDTLINIESLSFLDGTLSIKSLIASRPLPTFASIDNNGASSSITPSLYTGPVAFLEYELLGDITGNVIIASSGNDFMNLLGGDDAANGGLGDDVLDGGTDSNFLTGGGGTDTFFLDGRGVTTTWSTITDFVSGDTVNIWGWVQGTSQLLLTVASAGAAGFMGATYHYDLDGINGIDTSLTFSNLTLNQINSPTAQSVEDNGYLLFG